MYAFLSNIFWVVWVFRPLYRRGYRNFNRRCFIGGSVDLNLRLFNSEHPSFCRRQEVCVTLRIATHAVDPRIIYRLAWPPNNLEVFKTRRRKVVSIFIHFKINAQTLINTKCFFANTSLKRDLRQYKIRHKQCNI